MNLVYGVVGASDDIARSIHQKVLAQFGGNLCGASAGEGHYENMSVEVLSDRNSIIIGRAQQKQFGVSLVFIGSITLPAPDWSGDSPVNCPDVTAQYLLNRYLDHGEYFARGVIGQYAIAVIDHNRERLLLATDPTGIRTFFYTCVGGYFCFSSNMAILACSCPGISFNSDMEDFLLCYGYYPWQQTPYSEIKYVEPGAVAIFENSEFSTIAVDHPDPWGGQLEGLDFGACNEDRAIEVLYEAFMLATEQQLSSEKKAAVLLGGADSALVASALCRLGKEVETFSFYYEYSSFNQPHTDTLSNYLGIRHHWVPITPEVISNGLASYPWVFNFPTNWPNYVIQTQMVVDTIANMGIRHIYSGDGCDGTFLGYPRTHVFAKFLANSWRLSPWFVKIVTDLMDHAAVEYSIGRFYTLIMNSVRAAGRQMPERGYSNFRVFDETSLGRLKGVRPGAIVQRNEGVLRRLAAPLAGLSMDRLAYSGKNALSPNRSKLAGSSDSSGAVIHSPYLHSGMKRFALSIPDRFLRPEGAKDDYNGKYLLFKMADEKKLLPKDIIYQKKISAVDAPVDRWYSNEIKNKFIDYLKNLPFDTNFDYIDYILSDRIADKIYRKYVSSDAITSHAVALLATYARFASLVPR